MTTLFDIMLDLVRRTRTCYTGKATGGTTTTLVDTVYRKEEDDRWNGQTIFVLSGDNANTTRTISDFVDSTDTLTVDTAWSNSIASGVRYLIAESNREDLVQAINAALMEIGPVTNIDDSSLTVVNNQTEYTLPAGVNRVVRVEIAASSSPDYNYQPIYTWREIDGKLYLPDELGFDVGNKIRIYYNDYHDDVSADTDTLDDAIPRELISAIAAYYFTWQQYANIKNFSAKDEAMLSKVQNDKITAKQLYKVHRQNRGPILGSL